jgi:flagellar hook-associated protein 1 FlgK
MDQAQAAFGDPSSSTGYFNQLNSVFTAFASAANDPVSNLSRSQALDQVTSFLDATNRIASSLRALSQQTDTRINSDIDQVNQLLGQIDSLNTDITRAQSTGGDATGSIDAQSQLLDKLSSLIDIKVASTPNGGVIVRAGSGILLAGDGGPATLAYNPSAGGVGNVSITQNGAAQSTTFTVGSGELRGLLDLRDTRIPGVQDQLSTFVTGVAEAINQAHNASSAVPPPAVLTGRNTGLDLPTAISGFTGKTTLAVVDGSGQLQERVDIDFTAGTISVNGGAGAAFTAANFLTSLNTALGAAGSATFANGVLTLNATAAGTGIAITDDATTPSAKAGRGFSQFFGLNDLITSTSITNYNTGLAASDPNGFTAGGALTLRLSDASGATIRDVTVSVPVGTVQNMIDALNAPVGGVGQYGQFSLDANGALTFAPSTPGAATVSVITDSTQRGAGGPSASQLFGIGVAQRASRASTFSIRSDIRTNPANLALAQLNLGVAVGQPVVAIGDNAGALRLAQAADATQGFAAAGDLAAMTSSVTQYASQFGGQLGRKAAAADDTKTAAAAVKTEADTRRQAVEGVNLDEELVNLTTYQQAYSASARLVQAAKDMYDVLLGMVS